MVGGFQFPLMELKGPNFNAQFDWFCDTIKITGGSDGTAIVISCWVVSFLCCRAFDVYQTCFLYSKCCIPYLSGPVTSPDQNYTCGDIQSKGSRSMPTMARS